MTMPFFGFHSDKMNLNEANVLSVFSSVFPSKSVEVAPLVLDNISSPQLSVINEVKIVQPVFIVQEEKQVAAALPAEVLKEDVTIATAATPVVEETVSNAKYVIIMGAFKDKKNAQKLTETIAAESSTLKAKLIPNGKVSYVAIPAGNSEASAAAKLKEAKNINPDCWIKKM
jgi:cell division protein FtsN